MDESRSRELFSYIKKLHSTAAMNCEALRKLVKKFDKGATARGDEMQSSSLLIELYSASFMNYQCLVSSYCRTTPQFAHQLISILPPFVTNRKGTLRYFVIRW